MSDTKHMPGPWFIDPEDPLEICATDGDIAPWGVARAYRYGGYKVDTARANARLIAAAPDLLEALVALEHEYGPQTLRKAASAIAKVRGQS